MSYRQSSFDPNAHEQPGPPLKPYNWVQWAGVMMIVIALGLISVHLAGALGWIRPRFDSPTPLFILPVLGSLLINSRRGPGTPVDSLQLERNRRMLLIAVLVLAAIGLALAAFAFSGA